MKSDGLLKNEAKIVFNKLVYTLFCNEMLKALSNANNRYCLESKSAQLLATM